METYKIVGFAFIAFLAVIGFVTTTLIEEPQCTRFYTWEAQMADGTVKEFKTPHYTCFEEAK